MHKNGKMREQTIPEQAHPPLGTASSVIEFFVAKVFLAKSVLAALLLAVIASGCTTAPSTAPPAPTPSLSHLLENRFGPRPSIVPASRLHSLSAQQSADFQDYLNQPSIQNHPRHERVASYLHRITENFAYDEKTQSAYESLRTRTGNCMSLAVLTTALAREAGVEIGYQLVNSAPVFQWEGDLVLKGQHLRSVLFKPELESNLFTLVRGGIRIDYFPSPGERYVRRVELSEYLSMYYNNLAADALGTRDFNRTWWLLQESMRHLPNNVDALNVYALLYRRAGDEARAEEIYKAGIALNPEAVVLLRNYRTLLRALNRNQDADQVTQQLVGLEGAHPVDWLQAGSQEFKTGNYPEAIRYFNKAVEVAPYLHEAYLGLAQAYYAMDNTPQTRRQLKLALANANKAATRSLYQAKLGALDKAPTAAQ